VTVQDTVVPVGGTRPPAGRRSGVVRVLIYGSCVSRDAVEVNDDLTVAAYVARQSVISAMTPPVAVRSGQTGLASAFQRRMVVGDLGSDALKRIGEAGPGADIVLLDLIDERLGVLCVDGRSYATLSSELRHSTLLAAMPGARRIPFGTDEHFRLWRDAADRLVRELVRLGLVERTGFVWAVFAQRDENGEPVARYQGKSGPFWDALFDRYYRYLADVGLRHVRLDPDVRTSSAHRWGPQPYHYTQSAYDVIGDFVRAVVADRRRGAAGAQVSDASITLASEKADRVGGGKDIDSALLDAIREIHHLSDRLDETTRERDAALVERDAARRRAARLSATVQEVRSSATMRAGAALRAAASGPRGLVRLPAALWQIGRDQRTTVR